MKKSDLSPWFHATARLLGLRLDDKDRRAPTYPGDGRLCIARLKKAAHVVHEFAHFVDAIPSRRSAPNYGLGQDPDGGPPVPYADMLDMYVAEHIEIFTAFLTFPLLVEAELPWLQKMRESRWCEPRNEAEEEDQRWRIEMCLSDPEVCEHVVDVDPARLEVEEPDR